MPLPTNPKPPTFETFALETLNKATAIYNERGAQYADSWDLAVLQTPFTNLVVDCAAHYDVLAYKRLLACAALCDVKLSRIGGGFKEDTFIDLINYIAFFVAAWNRAESANG